MRLLLLIIFLGIYTYSHSQPTSPRERIESARIALITQRLQLTPEQAEKFWPLYNEYQRKTQALRKEYNDTRAKIDPQTASNEEKKELLDLGLTLKEQQVKLEREYSTRFLDVISTEQVIALRKAEEDFRIMLLEQIQKRRQHRQRNTPRDRPYPPRR